MLCYCDVMTTSERARGWGGVDACMECPSGIGGSNRHGICMGLPREAWCRGVYIYFRMIDLEGILFKKVYVLYLRGLCYYYYSCCSTFYECHSVAHYFIRISFYLIWGTFS